LRVHSDPQSYDPAEFGFARFFRVGGFRRVNGDRSGDAAANAGADFECRFGAAVGAGVGGAAPGAG